MHCAKLHSDTRTFTPTGPSILHTSLDLHVSGLQHKLHTDTINQYETIIRFWWIPCWVTNGSTDWPFPRGEDIHTEISPALLVPGGHASHLWSYDVLLMCQLLFMVTDAAMGINKRKCPPPPTKLPHPLNPQFLDRRGYELHWLKDISCFQSAAEKKTEANESTSRLNDQRGYFQKTVVFLCFALFY